MKCSYCHQDCILQEDDVGSEVWICRNHANIVKELISYTFHVAGQCNGPNCCPTKHHTATVIIFNDYIVKFRHTPNHNFCIYATRGTEPIFRLSFHPDLTPENIGDKLHLWITFS
jgi:hypothetical protein